MVLCVGAPEAQTPMTRSPLLPRVEEGLLLGHIPSGQKTQRFCGLEMPISGDPLWDGPPLTPATRYARRQDNGRSGPMQIAVLGIDLGKNSCSVVGLDGAGRVVLRRGAGPRHAR
jgi:hypothetical protein